PVAPAFLDPFPERRVFMALISIPDEQRTIEDVDEIRAFLKPHNIWYEKWDVESRISPDADAEDILAAFSKEVEELKRKGGYVTADVISCSPAVPNLEAMLAKFSKEHTHSEDEVRFIVKGAGVFHINLDDVPVFAIQVEGGDLINVPQGTRHWFNLCDDRICRAIRMFQDPAGWTPHYVDDNVDGNYQPLCFGPNYLPADKKRDSLID
ncbi:MAG: cupin domain-containing protein, partial [Planctomycetales bacterium]